MIQEIYIKNGLSKREAEVAELVSTGLSNKEVADKLFVTEKTIKFHLTNIYRKMNMSSRTQLIVWSLPYMGFNDIRNAQNERNAVDATPRVQEATSTGSISGASVFPVGINPLGKVHTND